MMLFRCWDISAQAPLSKKAYFHLHHIEMFYELSLNTVMPRQRSGFYETNPNQEKISRGWKKKEDQSFWIFYRISPSDKWMLFKLCKTFLLFFFQSKTLSIVHDFSIHTFRQSWKSSFILSWSGKMPRQSSSPVYFLLYYYSPIIVLFQI